MLLVLIIPMDGGESLDLDWPLYWREVRFNSNQERLGLLAARFNHVFVV
jgi:hypothetical protein